MMLTTGCFLLLTLVALRTHWPIFGAKASSTGPCSISTWVSGYMFYDARAQGAGEMFYSGSPKFYYFRAERLLAARCILCVPWWGTWQHLWGFASFISPGEVSKGGDSTGVKENKIWNAGIRRESFKQKERWGWKACTPADFMVWQFSFTGKVFGGFCFDR